MRPPAKPILFINHAFGLSGSVISLGYIVRGFTQNGYHAFVVQKTNDKGAYYLRECGATVFCVHFSIGLSLCSAVDEASLNAFDLLFSFMNIIKIAFGMLLTWRYIVKVKPCLLYVNEYVLVHCSIIGKIMNIPTVMHVRGPILQGRWGIRRWLLRKMILKWNDKVIAITEIEARQLFHKNSRRTHKCIASDVVIIYEFVKESNTTDNLEISKKGFSDVQTHKIVVTMLGVYLKLREH